MSHKNYPALTLNSRTHASKCVHNETPTCCALCETSGGFDLLYLEKTVSNAQKENNIQLTRKQNDTQTLVQKPAPPPHENAQQSTSITNNGKRHPHPETPPAFHLDTPQTHKISHTTPAFFKTTPHVIHYVHTHAHGSVAERTIAPVLKTGVSRGTVGSNPTTSAKQPPSPPCREQ